MDPSETPEIVARALAAEDVAALQALAASSDKNTSKAAKRALHRLRSRGVAIPDLPPPESSKAPALAAEEVREPMRATTYDSSGHRAIFLPLKAHLGFKLNVAVLSDESGVVSFDANELSRKQVRATIDELPADTRELLREVTPARAAAFIADALALAPDMAAAGRARELLRALPEPEAAAATSQVLDEASLRESAKLFETAPFLAYLPPREVLLSVSQKLEEVMVSPLLVDEAQRLAQLRHALERTTEEFFTAAVRARYAARLRDAAELFDVRGEDPSAAQARAAATALQSQRSIHEIPFARALFERIFDLQAALKAMAPPAAPASSPAPGGLILP